VHQISSRWTGFNKWVFPAIWCGVLVIFIGESVFDGTFERDPWFLLGPLFMIVVSLVVFRLYLWNLADAVFDHGGYLVARRRGVEARIPIDNIMNVNSSALSNPKRVTLRLSQPTALGPEIAFIPKTSFSFNPFAKVAVAENLIERAFAARTQSVV
jgi:hypothetical protein